MVKFKFLAHFQVDHLLLVFYIFSANLHYWLIMWLMVSSPSSHNLHLLFCCVLSILSQLWVKSYHYFSSRRITLALDNLQRLICHQTNKPNQTSILTLIRFVLMALFWVAIRKNYISLLSFPFLIHILLFLCRILLISLFNAHWVVFYSPIFVF